ncbi:hypothetical protein [Nocardia asiatica]|uniref:hypothetical protein n=1 Tax=Nocardia asiatica TaxID=209252 RepID=UPI0024553D7E|nr:hypothetical protein [Nocardia asiatica]
MTSEGDARENESDQSGSEFGPSVGEFGPPISEFGPPVAEFGPPMGADAVPGWQVPQQSTDHPELTWRPAGEPAPASPPQYRAPDSTVFTAPPAPAQPEPPAAEAPRPQPVDGERDTWWNRPTQEGGVPKPPAPSESGLSWAEDPIAMRLALRLPETPPPARRSSSRRWVVLGTLAAVVVLVALTVTIIVSSGSEDSQDRTAASSSAGTVAMSCPARSEGNVTFGNGPGDTSSGVRAILGFEHAYYSERSATRAHTFVAPGANVEPPADLQRTIDQHIPQGTAYCLRIAEMAPDRYNVEITERRPDGTEAQYFPVITTVNLDGRTLIYLID